MEDSDLTRMAVAEIIKEMHLGTTVKTINPVEKKVNPLGKPNKRFLNRTLNSIMTYNKREGDRTQENCRQKIKELDYIQKRRKRKKDLRGFDRRKKDRSRSRSRSRSKSSHKSCSNNSSNGYKNSQKSIRKRLKKKRKGDKKHRRISSSSSSCSSSSSNRSDDNNNYRGSKRSNQYDKYVCDNYFDAEEGDIYEYSVAHAHMFTSLGVAAAAYSHINQYLYQQELGNTKESQKLQTEVEDFKMTELNDFEQCDVKTENISLLSNEESFSSSVSAWSEDEVDESGILTIRVSSDEEITKVSSKRKSKSNKKNVPECTISSSSSAAEGEDDEEEETANVSWNSCISLNSTDAEPELESENVNSANLMENSMVEILISDEETKVDGATNDVNCKELPEKIEMSAPTNTDMIDLTDD